MLPVEDYLCFVDEALDAMAQIVTELGDDLANRRATPDGNSPYVLLTHCLGVMEWWGGHAIAGRPIDRDRDAEFTASGAVADLVARVPESWDRFVADLADYEPTAPPVGAMDPEDLDHPLGRSQAGALFHLHRELAQHLGQMESVRDVLQAG